MGQKKMTLSILGMCSNSGAGQIKTVEIILHHYDQPEASLR